MIYKTFLGTYDFISGGEAGELQDELIDFFECISEDGITFPGSFVISEEIVQDYPLYYGIATFPSWAEALFLIKFYEYNWKLLEES